MTDHLPARQLARREPADRFRQLERHLDAGVEGEVGGSLQKHTRFTDVYGAAALPRLLAYDSIQRGISLMYRVERVMNRDFMQFSAGVEADGSAATG